eukprot:1145307-Pelagomonas_calceolata.AAC.2
MPCPQGVSVSRARQPVYDSAYKGEQVSVRVAFHDSAYVNVLAASRGVAPHKCILSCFIRRIDGNQGPQITLLASSIPKGPTAPL